MNDEVAVARLSALAHRTRMAVFRLLVKKGPGGMTAGDIARAVRTPPTTMSTHLAILARADLIEARRDGRTIIYAVNKNGVSGLVAYLVSDCCGGQPELCGGMIAAAAKGECAPRGKARR